MGGDIGTLEENGSLAFDPDGRRRGMAEETLRAIWCDVLQVEDVQGDDDFFGLGGDSVLALQVAVRIEAAFGVTLTLPEVFERRTLGELAGAVDAGAGRGDQKRHIKPRQRDRGPLSLVQAATLATARKNNVPTVARVFRLRGPLDLTALERAIAEVVRRHHVLRTVYRSTLGRHRQVVVPPAPAPLSVVDVRDRRRGGPADHRQVVADNVTTAFDLQAGPVLRPKLVRLAKQEHLLSISMHEIAGDGWSVPILLGELGTLYDDFASGREPSLSPPPIQYLDYAFWQRKNLTRGVRRRQIRYWKDRLAHAPIALDLTPDLWPAAFDEPEPRVADMRMGAPLVARVDSMARGEGCSLFLALVAACQTLVHHLTHSPRVVLRPTFANRTTVQVEPMIGFFVNFVLADTDVSDDPTFGDLLARVRRDFLEATTRSEIPLSNVLRHIARMRTASGRWPGGPLRFQFFNFPEAGTLTMAGLSVRAEDHGVVPTDHFGIGVSPLPDGSLLLRLHYDGSLFRRAAAERFLTRFCGILEQATEDLDTSVSSFSLLNHGERDRMRRGCMGGALGPVTSLVDSIWEHAARAPDAIAVASADESVSYRDLTCWADEVARTLVSHTGDGSPVLLVAFPGAAFAAGLLATMRAGGTCLPLDPRLPKKVLHALAQQVSPAVVVADAMAIPLLPRQLRADAVVLDGDRSGGVSGRDPVMPGGGDFVACSFHGGGPARLAVLSHEALDNAVAAQRAMHKLGRTDRVAELPDMRLGLPHPLLATLLAGGTYVVADRPVAPADWVVDQRISVCFADGPSARLVVSASEDARSPLRLLVSDEPITAPTRRCRFTVAEQPTLPEVGGPWAIAHGGRTRTAPAFCGTPAPGVFATVVDGSMNMVPPLVPGELVVGGPSLARQYLNDSDATAFVANPFPEFAGERLFRTGMTARVDDRQRIELLGMGEGQWSVRGMPMGVYLRSIEAALREHPAVGAVLARVAPVLREPRVKVTVARVPGLPAPRSRELARMLPKGLPAYATPLLIKVVDRFPRRPDGGVDYEALDG